MGNKAVRVGQLIAPFGVGSIYTDRRGTPHVIAGLDHWFSRLNPATQRMEPCSDRAEFERVEPRLSALLGIGRFCTPPDYRQAMRGSTPPPNAGLQIPALRFPRWYRHTKTGQLQRFNLEATRIANPPDGGRWRPVRFIAVCEGGHLCEFPWKAWLDCNCADETGLFLTDRGGSELTSVRVECRTCPSVNGRPRAKSLSGTTIRPEPGSAEKTRFEQKGIGCPGDRPWLGEDAAEQQCPRSLVAALLNQTNIYFPRTLSAITLPDLSLQDDEVASLRSEIERDEAMLGVALTLWRMGGPDERADVAADLTRKLIRRGVTADEAKVFQALESLFDGAGATPAAAKPEQQESPLLEFRRAEFSIIRHGIDEPVRVPNLRVVQTEIPDVLRPWIERVALVERLREMRVFYGFDRLTPSLRPLAGMPSTALDQLFRRPPEHAQDRWLPAVEVFGEGIYIELRAERLDHWLTEMQSWIAERVTDALAARLQLLHQTLPPDGAASAGWAARYLVVHTLAHILINQLVFECGYSTASLRERLYISADRRAPMAGLLIYTAAGDSEGTLGGLVRLGQPDRLGPVVLRALSRASWCSADPVCSEQIGGQGSRRVNLAACHACVLLPETSCETINQGLDRGLVVGTADSRATGLFSELQDVGFDLS